MVALSWSAVKIETPGKSPPDESETCPLINDCPKAYCPRNNKTKIILRLSDLISLLVNGYLVIGFSSKKNDWFKITYQLL